MLLPLLKSTFPSFTDTTLAVSPEERAVQSRVAVTNIPGVKFSIFRRWARVQDRESETVVVTHSPSCPVERNDERIFSVTARPSAWVGQTRIQASGDLPFSVCSSQSSEARERYDAPADSTHPIFWSCSSPALAPPLPADIVITAARYSATFCLLMSLISAL